MEFKKYQHLERFGKTEVQDIEIGKVVVFPKLDGSNSQVWLDDSGEIKAGSRNRELSWESGKDNAGFYKFATADEKIKKYLEKHPTHRLYGEWLVPHTVKTYRDDAWRRFYIFDICIDKDNGEVEYIPYDTYKPLLDEFELDYIVPICTITNGTYDDFVKSLEQNTFMVKDGEGVGEGIVIKNYDYYNRFGRQVWAKIVTNEFKENHKKTMGVNDVSKAQPVEQLIVDEFCTESFIEKECAKIYNDIGECGKKQIPMILGKIYNELIREETWNFIKKHKNPTINFKLLNSLTINKVKTVKKDIFG